jgi:hypothetical protein
MEGFSEFLSEEVREVSHSQKEGPVLFRHLVDWVAKVRTEVDELVSVFVIVASETLIFKFDQRQASLQDLCRSLLRKASNIS